MYSVTSISKLLLTLVTCKQLLQARKLYSQLACNSGYSKCKNFMLTQLHIIRITFTNLCGSKLASNSYNRPATNYTVAVDMHAWSKYYHNLHHMEDPLKTTVAIIQLKRHPINNGLKKVKYQFKNIDLISLSSISVISICYMLHGNQEDNFHS